MHGVGHRRLRGLSTGGDKRQCEFRGRRPGDSGGRRGVGHGRLRRRRAGDWLTSCSSWIKKINLKKIGKQEVKSRIMANSKQDKDIVVSTESDKTESDKLQAITLQAMIYRMMEGQKDGGDPSERDRALYESFLMAQFGDPKQCHFTPDKDMRYLCNTCGFPKDKH